MKKLKRRLALLLTALMLITTLPVTALAAEPEDGNIDLDPVAVEDVPVAEEPNPSEFYEDLQAVGSGGPGDDGGVDPQGYQYIETIDMSEVDLTAYLAEELKALPLSELLPGVDLQNITALAVDDNSYGNVGGNGEYAVISTEAGTIDLSSLLNRDYYSSSYYNDMLYYSSRLEIINSDDQLNTNATRYVIPVRTSRLSMLLDLDAYFDGKQLDTDNDDWYRRDRSSYELRTDNPLPEWDVKQSVVSMNLNAKLPSELTNGLTAKVYKGSFRTMEEIDPAQEITEQIWNTGADGYKTNWLTKPEFTVVLERNGRFVQILNLTVSMLDKGVDFGFDLSTVGTEDTPAEKIDVEVYTPGSSYYRENIYYVYPENYDTWQSGEATLKLRYKAAEDYRYPSSSNQVYTDYADKTDVTVYTGYYEDEDALRMAVMTNQTQDVTHDIWDADGEGYTADYTDMRSRQAFTVVVKEKDSGETAYFVPFYVYMNAQAIGPVRVWAGGTLYVNLDNNITSTRNIASEKYEQDPETLTNYYTMKYTTIEEMQAGYSYPMDGKYYVEFYVQGETMDESYESALAKIDRIEDQNGQDVKDAMLGSYGYNYYQVDFSKQPVIFTVYFTDETAAPQEIRLRTLPAAPPERQGSTDTYFNVTGVNGYETYAMPSHADSSFHNGFQVIFVDATAEELDGKEVTVTYTTGSGVRMYRRHDEMGQRIDTENEISTTITSGEPLLFSAASESGTHLRNYWITFITRDPEAKLWVNGQNDTDHVDKVTGLPLREMFIYQTNGSYDIFFANIGAEPLTGLEVNLTSANNNIRLDDYWTIGDTKTLAGFTTTKIHQTNGHDDNYSQLENMAKIRIWASGQGIVDAILTITADGQEPVSLKLSGKVGQAAIVSSAVPDGVKYVPYSCLIQTNYIQGFGSRPTFQIVGGTLPANVSINEKTGEIYGVPRAWGVFSFTVGLFQDGQMVDSRSFTMNIADNTDENVWNASDEPYYVVIDPVGDQNEDSGRYVIDLSNDELLQDEGIRTFVSDGPYLYYVKVFLDSNLLEPGVDYFSDEGSTKIVLAEGTVKGNNSNGSHTLAIEFRESDGRRTVDDEVYQGTLKRTSQNYYIEGGVNPSAPQQPSIGGNNNTINRPGSSSGASRPSTSKPANTPTQPSTPSTPDTPAAPVRTFSSLADIKGGDWFYDDIRWAWEQELMTGISDTEFAPDTPVSQAMIVVILARLVNVDLSAFENVTVAGAEPGAWYTTAAAWAQQTGLLPDNSAFSGDGALSRDSMAIMLVKYLASMGVDTTVGGELAFDDMDQMTDAGRNAFQVLCHYNIFKGMGDNTMNPGGATTRAQFATLLHRVSDYVANR